MLGAAASSPPVGTCRAGREIESRGRATSAAAAAVHTKCREAAERLRSASAINQAAQRTAMLLKAAPRKIADHADSLMTNIHLPSFLALSIISDMRSSSSLVSRVEEIGRASCRARV